MGLPPSGSTIGKSALRKRKSAFPNSLIARSAVGPSSPELQTRLSSEPSRLSRHRDRLLTNWSPATSSIDEVAKGPSPAWRVTRALVTARAHRHGQRDQTSGRVAAHGPGRRSGLGLHDPEGRDPQG